MPFSQGGKHPGVFRWDLEMGSTLPFRTTQRSTWEGNSDFSLRQFGAHTRHETALEMPHDGLGNAGIGHAVETLFQQRRFVRR